MQKNVLDKLCITFLKDVEQQKNYENKLCYLSNLSYKSIAKSYFKKLSR
jgi:hypothetical protein